MSHWLPSLNALRAFEAVARHLNYRLAAEELSVSPAAVKQLVAKLEDTLGIELFERRGRGIELSTQGAAGCEDLSRAFQLMAASVASIRSRERRKRLIVSVEPSFATAWLVPRLESFRSNHGDVDVLIDSSLQIVDLERGGADLAIRFGRAPDNGLVGTRLFDEEICAFCSPGIVRSKHHLAQIKDLQQVALLHWDLTQYEWASATRKWMDWKTWLIRTGSGQVAPAGGLHFSDYNLALQAAIAGQGVILGSKPVLARLVAAGLLVDPFNVKVTTDIGYDLVTTERAKLRPEVQYFINWITAEAGSAEV
jgi:LysR family glycine cleavage system transcriptional activator